MTDAEHPSLAALIEELDSLSKAIGAAGVKMLRAHDDNLYVQDLFAFGAIKRSFAHIAGYKRLVEEKNLICAAPLIRMQIDTAIRFAAISMVKSPQDLFREFLQGTRISEMTDRDGKKMTDAYLVRKLGEKQPWLPKTYEETSGYIHLSEKHFFSCVVSSLQNGEFSFAMSAVDDRPEEEYVRATMALIAGLKVFLRLLEDWIGQKSTPGPGEAEYQSKP